MDSREQSADAAAGARLAPVAKLFTTLARLIGPSVVNVTADRRLASVADRVRRPFTAALEQDELEALVPAAVAELVAGGPEGASGLTPMLMMPPLRAPELRNREPFRRIEAASIAIRPPLPLPELLSRSAWLMRTPVCGSVERLATRMLPPGALRRLPPLIVSGPGLAMPMLLKPLMLPPVWV